MKARGALGRAEPARVDAVERDLSRRHRRSRPERGAGWSCRCRSGRPGRPARPPRPPATASSSRPGSDRPDGGEHHDVTRQRICATSQRKKGAPIKAVTTPIGSVRPSGARRTARSAAISSSAPIIAAGRIARPGWPRTSRRAKIGAIRPMKPIAPQIATQAPTPSAVRQTICSRRRRTSWPSDCATSSPSASRSSAGASRSSSRIDEQGRDGGEGGLVEAAVDQRAHQPVIGVVESEGGGGERQRERGQRPRQRADRQARRAAGSPSPPAARPARAAGASARSAPRHRADRQSASGADEAEIIGGHHRAQRRAAGRAGEVGGGERVGEQRLDRRARRAERRAIGEREQGARQAKLDQHRAGEVRIRREQAPQRPERQQQRRRRHAARAPAGAAWRSARSSRHLPPQPLDLVDQQRPHAGPAPPVRRRVRDAARASAPADGRASAGRSNIGRPDSRCAAAGPAGWRSGSRAAPGRPGSGRWLKPGQRHPLRLEPGRRRRFARRRRARSCRPPAAGGCASARSSAPSTARARLGPAERRRDRRTIRADVGEGLREDADRASGCRAARRCRSRSRAPPPIVTTRSGRSSTTESRLPSLRG